MLSTTIALTFLQLTASVLAAPTANAPNPEESGGYSLWPGTTPGTALNPNILRKNNSTQPSSNGTTPISYPVDNTPITLLITPLIGEKIARQDLVTTLYDSREYVRRHVHEKGDSRLQGPDEPFSSKKLPSPPAANCILDVKSGGQLKSLTYKYLEDTVQGLMDYTFYPYTGAVNSLSFQVSHEIWGVLGSGTLHALAPQTDGAGTGTATATAR